MKTNTERKSKKKTKTPEIVIMRDLLEEGIRNNSQWRSYQQF